MEESTSEQLPRRVHIAESKSERYPDNMRPVDWDFRRAGADVVKTVGGEELRLISTGQQSPPQPGWVIMLTAGDAGSGYSWTLYGLPPSV